MKFPRARIAGRCSEECSLIGCSAAPSNETARRERDRSQVPLGEAPAEPSKRVCEARIDTMMGTAPLTAGKSQTEIALRRLRASIQECKRCDALVRCRSRVVPGDGSAPAEVAFVGIAPGRLGGDRTGIPFSGDRSGQLLRRMIEHSGLEQVFITNLVRCNPRDSAGRNRDPTPAEIARCREHFRAEFSIVRPRIVACLGRMAWQELAGRAAPFTPMGGKAVEIDGLLLFPMYHPAFVNRGAYPMRFYARDFVRLSRLSASIR
jgi:uracil-DNA glycosylase family 4